MISKRDPSTALRVTVFTALLLLTVSGINLVLQPTPAIAAAANTINFQARLENLNGSIVADGTYNVEFNIYSVSSGGSTLWTEDWLNSNSQGITVKNGYLTANLGSITAFPTNIWNQQLWLGMTVRGTGSCAWGSCTPADSEMSPRLKLTAVPAAYSLVNTNGSFSSTLTLQAPTGGNQTFVLQDQAAAGTYNICIQNSTACGFAPVSGTLAGSYIQNQNSAQQATSNFWISGTGRADTALQAPLLDTPSGTTTLNIGTNNATAGINLNQDVLLATGKSLTFGSGAGAGNFDMHLSTGTFQTGTGAISLNGNVTVAAGQSITMVGGITSTRPASPTAGMLYFDTTTNQLLQYNGTKWMSDKTTATKVVAMGTATGCTGTSPVASAGPDGADYVVTSCTSAQTTINSALTAAAGGTVYLEEGTYIIDGSISIPNNTVLSGAGPGTIIEFKDSINANFQGIVNTDNATGTNIAIQNLAVDGNKANQSGSVAMTGISLSHMGSGSGNTANDGAKINGVIVRSIYDSGGSTASGGITLTNSNNNIITNSMLLAAGWQGISLNTSSYNTLTGNLSQGNQTSGFYITGTYNTLTGNTAQGNGYGIWLAGASKNTLTGNTLQNNNNGIWAQSSSSITITGNTFASNSSGLELTSTTTSEISGNDFLSNTTYGMHATSSSNNSIVSNKFHDNGGSSSDYGIYLANFSSYNTISSNDITDTSCTVNCYAINISTSTAANNYLSDNNYSGDGTHTASINDLGTGTIYANQADASGNLIIKSQGGGLGIGQGSAAASLALQGGERITQIATPSAPTVTVVGTAGTTTWGYKITALDGNGETLPSSETQVTTGNATLDGTNYNTISWNPIGGAYQYRVYRTTAGGTPNTTGLIATINGNTTTYNDQGAAASGSLPNVNTTGGLYVQGNSAFGTSPSTNIKLTVAAGGTDTGISITNSNGTGLSVTGSGSGNGISSFNFGTGIAVRGGASGNSSGFFQTTNTAGTNAFATLVAEANSNQTADLLQAQNSSGASLTSISATGQLRVGATYAAMTTPSGLNPAGPSSGGSLAATTTYYYKVTAIDSAGGETAASSEASNTTTSSNKTFAVGWSAVTGASGYKLYRATTSGSEVYLTTVLKNSFTDDGTITAGSATPPSSTTAYESTNVSMNNVQLTVGGNGTPTGQLYIGGNIPTSALNSIGIGGGTVNDIKAQGRYVYVTTNGGKLQIYDAANPSRLVLLGSVSVGSAPYSLYVVGHYAYVINNASNTFQIIDVTNPVSPTITSTTATGISPSYVYVQGRYAFVVNSASNNLQIFDINNPSSPSVVSTTSTGSVPSSVFVQGRYAYVANTNANNFQIFDVSNPLSPTSISTTATTSGPANVRVQGRYLYVTTSGNFQTFDISNPSSPQSVGTIAIAGQPFQFILQDRYAYIGNISGHAVNVVDISNPANLSSIGSVGAGNAVYSLYAQGRYLYGGVFTSLITYDLGGTYSQQLEAGGAEVGTLQVDGNEQIAGDSNIQGGLSVGQSIQAGGNLGVAGNAFVQGTLAIAGGIQGGVTVNGISTPGAPTVTTVGTAGSTNYSYTVTAVSAAGGETVASSDGSTSTGNATLTGSNYNAVSWSAVTGAVSYKVYRTVASGTSPTTTGLIGTTSATSLNDTGLAASGSSPTFDSTGSLTVNGTVLARPTTDSTSAFKLQNAAGTTDVLTVSSSNGATTLNSSSSSAFVVHSTGCNSNPLAVNATGTGQIVSVALCGGIGDGVAVAGGNNGGGTYFKADLSSRGGGSTVGLAVTGATTSSSVFTGNYILVNPTRAWTGASVNETGNFLNLTRNNTVNNAGSTYTISGALANLQSNCTQIAGTCTDTSNILNLNQQYASASGAVVNIQNAGTGADLQFTKNGHTIGIGASASLGANYALILPTAAPGLSQCLQNDGTTIGQLTWGSCGGGSISLGTYSTTNTDAHGATLSSGVLTFQDASASAPGMVGTGNQTFAGVKTFNSGIALNAPGNAVAITLLDGASTASEIRTGGASSLSAYFGRNAGAADNNSAYFNVGIGDQALQGMSTGGYNIGIGTSSLNANTSGTDNTAVGSNALTSALGSSNTALGSGAGSLLGATGDNNLLLGYNAGSNLTTGSNNIIIGASVNAPSATGSNQLQIGNVIQGDLSAVTLTLQGSTTLAAGKNFTYASGTGNFDQSASSGTFATGSGSVSLNGNTSVTGSNTFATGTGNVSLNGNTATASGKSLTVTAGNVAFTKGADYSTTGSTDANLGAGALFRLTGASAQTLTGIQSGTDGRTITLVNAAGQAATICDSSQACTTGTAADRITTGTGNNLSLAAGASINLVYDSGASLWRVVGSSGGGSVSLGAVDSAGSANANGATLTGSVLNLNSADGTHPGVVNATTQSFGGNKTFLGTVTLNPTVGASAFAVQNAGNSALVFDNSSNILKVYDPSNSGVYASITATSTGATFASSSGTTTIGSGSGSGGNINLLTTNLTDTMQAYHQVANSNAGSLAAAYSDFSFQRQVNDSGTNSYSLQGNVLDVEDVSTLGSSTTSSPNVLYVNQNNGTATGNLILAQTTGNTSRFKVDTAGNVDISGAYKINGTTICTSSGCTPSSSPTLQAAYDASSSPATITTSSTSKGILFAAGTGSDTSSLFVIQNAGGTQLFKADSSTGRIQVGSGTTDSTVVTLQLDSVNTYGASPTCSATTNQGAMFYNTASNSIRACIHSNWEDLVSTSGLGIMGFGVIADTGTSQGDVAGVSGNTNSPCKVTWTSTTSVTVNPCAYFSGGRKNTLDSAQTITGLSTASTWYHICADGASNTFQADAGTETTGLPTFSTNNPILCLADVVTGSGGTITNIYDVRTFTDVLKRFFTASTATALGMVVVQDTSGPGLVKTIATSGSAGIDGVVVATTGTASTNTINVIVATRGALFAKTSGTGATLGKYAETLSSPQGYVTGTTATLGKVLGPIYDAADTACTASTNCQYSVYVDGRW